MTAADFGRRVQRRFEQLLDVLADPARRERGAAAALLGYTAVWTLYAVIAKGSQDIHYDMAEQVALSQELAFGYAKHPPLAAAMVRAWFTLFPLTDWAYYLLAVATAALALWIAWRLSARFLDGEKRVLGLALLTLVPFFNFHALKFNQNTLLMPLWAATTLFFLRSFETRRVADAALAGVTAAAAMYGKYWSIFLIAGLGVAALADSRRAVYFRSPAPWVTIAVGALALAPHVAWLVANGFEPFSYAVLVHGGTSVMSALGAAIGYLAGSVGYVAVAVVFAILATRPSPAAARDSVWPATPERRLAAVAFWATLLLPALVAIPAEVRLTSLWSMPSWTLLPVMLLSSPLLAVDRQAAARILMVAVLFPLVMVAAAPAIAVVAHRARVTPAAAHSSLLAAPVERLWRETSGQPLRLFSSYEDFNYGVAFYLPSRPLTVNALDGVPPPGLDARIARDGIVLVCPAQVGGCVTVANAIAGRGPAGKRIEVDVTRRFWGVAGPSARYLIIAIPPRR
jgi:4-amino-4-deoxy-L-arabinose transferase-like glycosyltransferase